MIKGLHYFSYLSLPSSLCLKMFPGCNGELLTLFFWSWIDDKSLPLKYEDTPVDGLSGVR